MLQNIFHVQIARFDGLLNDREIADANVAAIAADLQLNPFLVPYSRPDKTSLDVLFPEVFGVVFDKVRAATEAAYGVHVTSLIGRESVFLNGQHLPVHVEGESHLSGVLWLDWSATPNPQERDYNGMFCMNNPSGVVGFKDLPFEAPRSMMFPPASGALVLHPSYVPHYVFPYKGERPGVEIHFEILVEKKQ